jgi:hypothetical protein
MANTEENSEKIRKYGRKYLERYEKYGRNPS